MTLLLGACGDDKNTTDTESTGTADTTATDTTATATATDSMGSATSTGDDATAGGATDSGNSSTTVVSTTDLMPTTDGSETDGTATGGSETDGTTTGGDDLMMLCETVCEKFSACMVEAPADCVMECIAESDGLDPSCKAASEELYACIVTMTCDELTAFQDDEDPGPCLAQTDKVSDACSDQACSASAGSNREGTECGYDVTCPDTPPQSMSCDTETCTCTTGGQEVGSCPAEGACMSLEMIEAKAADCCGF